MLNFLKDKFGNDKFTVFWKWFQKNEDDLFNFEKNQDEIFDKLAEELGKIDSNLTFEFGPKKGEHREFIISAGGILEAFPAVEQLYEKKPELKRWKVIKFVPQKELTHLQLGEHKFKPEDIGVALFNQGDKIGLTLFFDGYTEKNDSFYGQVGYIYLDQALGEYFVATKIGSIERKSKKEPLFKHAIPLTQLSSAIDKLIKK